MSIPDVPVLPLFTPLFLFITIATITAPMTREKVLSHPPSKPTFPTSPQKRDDVRFRLCRNLVLSSQGFDWITDEIVACFFGVGTTVRDVVADVELA